MAIKFKRGDRFGRLTIVDDTYSFSKADGGGNIRRYWRCICECGNETYVAASFLKSGSIQSCGCLTKDKIIEASRIDEIGNRYGKLTVIEYAYTKNNRAYWKCKCDCGNYLIVQAPHLRTGNTQSCGKCTRLSVGEEKICRYLIENNICYDREVTFSTCRDIQMLPFDFAIYQNDNLYCLIEYQGKQHYIATGGWSDEEQLKYVQNHDFIKEQWAKDNNIPLYIIPYWEFENIESILSNIIDAEASDMEESQDVEEEN